MPMEAHVDPQVAAKAVGAAIGRDLGIALGAVPEQLVADLDEPDEQGRTVRVTVDLQLDFALNQPLSTFALAAIDLLDPESDTYGLDVVSVIEATLDDPRQILAAQLNKARGEAVAQMKAEGIEYDERIELLDWILGLLRDQAAGPEQQGQQQRKPARH